MFKEIVASTMWAELNSTTTNKVEGLSTVPKKVVAVDL